MTQNPAQPERDEDDLLLEAEASGTAAPPRAQDPEGTHPRIPESVARRLRDRTAGVEFDPHAVRGASSVRPSESPTTAPASASRPAPVPSPAPQATPEPAPDAPAEADVDPTPEAPAGTPAEPAPVVGEPTASGEWPSSSLPAPTGHEEERPTRRSRMTQLPETERTVKPTALSGGLPQGQRAGASEDDRPAPWGRLAPQQESGREGALSLWATTPKPVTAADVSVPRAAGTEPSVGDAAAEGSESSEPVRTFGTTRIVLGVILLLLIVALILLVVL